jgi:putative transport protein
VNRAGIDLAPTAALRLQFGDRVVAVGPESGLRIVEAELGNSPDMLNRPQLVPIFLGIALGVLVGSIPLVIPGLHTRLRIGLAGGPLLAAIALSQLGSIGSVVWYIPIAASTLFRDFGLAVFLACVGLQSGNGFLQNLVQGGGVELVAWGAAVTVVPILVVGLFARSFLKMNFVTLSGWVAGAMTSTPAMMFAKDLAGSDAPATVYAAVAPLGLLTPIICSQLLVLMMYR